MSAAPAITSVVPTVTIVVPTYNEVDNLEPLVSRIAAVCDAATTDLLIIDDDSPDGTAALAARLAPRFPVHCYVRKGERGLATAVLEGMDRAGGDIIVVMDADLSHPPEAIPALLEPLRDPEVNMTLGSRFVAGGNVDVYWPWHRRLNSWGARLLARPLTPVCDMMSGFFAVRRGELQLDRLHPIGYKIALELMVRHGWRRVVEVPISFRDRHAGRTKLNLSEQLRYVRHLGRLYSFALRRAIFGA